MKEREEEILRIRIVSPPAQVKHVRFSFIDRFLISAPLKLFYLNLYAQLPDIGLNNFCYVNNLLVCCCIKIERYTVKTFLLNKCLCLLYIKRMLIWFIPFSQDIRNRTSCQAPTLFINRVQDLFPVN